MQSAIEVEIQKRIAASGAWLRSHDRGVLLALLLSIPPFIPLPVIGMSLSLINYWLLTTGRLPPSEGRLVKITLVIGLLSLVLGVLITIQAMHLLQLLPDYLPGWITKTLSFINSIRDFFYGSGRYTQV